MLRYPRVSPQWFLTGQILRCDLEKVTGWVRHLPVVVPPKLQVKLDDKLIGTAKFKPGSEMAPDVQQGTDAHHSPSLSKPKYWEFNFRGDNRPYPGSVLEVCTSWSGAHLAGSPWTFGGVPISPLVFMHIPKTAGTSLRAMLEAAYDKSGVFPSRDYLRRVGGGYVRPAQLAEVLQGVGENTSLILGHYRYNLLRKILPQSSIFTMVRSPESQIVSLLKHKRAQTGASYESLALEPSGVVSPTFRNIQAKFFLSDNELKRISKDTAKLNSPDDMEPLEDLVTQRLGEIAFIGVSEKFQESCMKLEGILGRSLGDSQRDNTTRLPDEKVSADLIDRLLEENHIDQLIYDLAAANL